MILDVCCGSQAFYFDKHRDDVITMDIRRETHYKYGATICVDPDIVGDFRDIPFSDNCFSHVIFDPPHLLRAGDKSIMAARYGKLARETWREDVQKGLQECYRVLRPGGTLVFKWSEYDIKVGEVLGLCPAKPLYGHRRGNAVWLIFVKREEKS